MGRRRFEHLFVEICVAAGIRLQRYPLWLCLHEQGFDPEALSQRQALAFCDGPLAAYLEGEGLELSPRARRRLRRTVARFDPAIETAAERVARY